MTTVWLAHGSGIDDLAWFVLPLLVGFLVLRWAERRAKARRDDEGEDGG